MPDLVAMQVISNTSPLYYLNRLRLLDILPRLYGEIVITPDIEKELASQLEQLQRAGFYLSRDLVGQTLKLAR